MEPVDVQFVETAKPDLINESTPAVQFLRPPGAPQFTEHRSEGSLDGLAGRAIGVGT